MQYPDVVIIMTDEERNIPPYEGEELRTWRENALPARHWFEPVSYTHLTLPTTPYV